MPVMLTTQRLRLRRWRLEDFEPLAAFLGDAELSRYRCGPLDQIAAWEFMCARAGEWTVRGYGGFVIEERSSGAVIGMAGLWHPASWPEPELFWGLFAGHHGKGHAVEAARRVLTWVSQDLRLPPLMSLVHPDNAASRRVAERLGGSIEGETIFRGYPRLIYRHAAAEVAP